jgi:hypothetical protein
MKQVFRILTPHIVLRYDCPLSSLPLSASAAITVSYAREARNSFKSRHFWTPFPRPDAIGVSYAREARSSSKFRHFPTVLRGSSRMRPKTGVPRPRHRPILDGISFPYGLQLFHVGSGTAGLRNSTVAGLRRLQRRSGVPYARESARGVTPSNSRGVYLYLRHAAAQRLLGLLTR